MKRCTKCGEKKAFSEYRKSSTTRDKLTTYCRLCLNAYGKPYRESHKKQLKALNKMYAVRDAEKRTQRTKEWIKNNPEKRKQQLKTDYEKRKKEGRLQTFNDAQKECNRKRSKQWRALNKGRVNAQIAKRRATALQATPLWAEFEQIAVLYVKARHLTETTGIDHEVDHIVPLKSDVVCGLHCLSNLRILTANANNRKKCKLIGAV